MDKFEVLKLTIYWIVSIGCGTSVIMGVFLYFTIKFNAWNRFSREFFCESNSSKLDKDSVGWAITPFLSTMVFFALICCIVCIIFKFIFINPISFIHNGIIGYFEKTFNKLEEENMKHNNPIENIKNKR